VTPPAALSCRHACCGISAVSENIPDTTMSVLFSKKMKENCRLLIKASFPLGNRDPPIKMLHIFYRK